tara:strand:- start:289 stop:519 length:231 start_codon:yes stop_codon:yes gene_type:complete
MIIDETNQYIIILEKILEHVKDEKIQSKKDLKLYGIEGEKLQKDVMWEIFEKYVVEERDKKEKSNIIRKFHRSNLL